MAPRGKINTAFLFGAGLGKRLRPLTENCPKPLLPIAGRPMIFHALDRLISIGISRFIINTHHCADRYLSAFPNGAYGNFPVVLSREPVLLDTGGGLKNIEQCLKKNDTDLLVCNGDIFAAPDFEKLIAFHNDTDAEAALLLRSSGTPLNVRCDENGVVTDMRNRLGSQNGDLHLFTGIYCVRRDFFAHLPMKIESVVETFLRRIEENPGVIRGFKNDTGYWHDLGTVGEYERVNREFSAL